MKNVLGNMRLFLASAVVGTLTLLAAAPCHAIYFYDIDEINRKLTAGTGSGSYHSDTFNILQNGFVPGTHHVTAALVTFKLSDDSSSDSGESFSINLDGGPSELSGSYMGWVTLGPSQIGINLLASLNADGILNYTVSATSGDFWLKTAFLGVQATGGAHSVPDTGGTLILAALGMGLLVVGTLATRQELKPAVARTVRHPVHN